jgi:antitoxin MazE
MKTSLRKIGNSRGVLIPASFLKECNMTDTVEIDIVDDRIIISAVQDVRKGWFDAVVPDAAEFESIRVDDGITDWEWK